METTGRYFDLATFDAVIPLGTKVALGIFTFEKGAYDAIGYYKVGGSGARHQAQSMGMVRLLQNQCATGALLSHDRLLEIQAFAQKVGGTISNVPPPSTENTPPPRPRVKTDELSFELADYAARIPAGTKVIRLSSGTVYEKVGEYWVSLRNGQPRNPHIGRVALIRDQDSCGTPPSNDLIRAINVFRQTLLADEAQARAAAQARGLGSTLWFGEHPENPAIGDMYRDDVGELFVFSPDSTWLPLNKQRNDPMENEIPSTTDAVKSIFQDAAAMAVATKTRDVIHGFVEKKLGANYPEQMKTPAGKAVVGAIELIVAHYAVSQFQAQIPKGNLLKIAIEKALTFHVATNMVLFMEFFGAYLKDVKELVTALAEMQEGGGDMGFLKLLAGEPILDAEPPVRAKEKVEASRVS